MISYDRARWLDVGYGLVTAGFRTEAVRLASEGISGRYKFADGLGAARLLHGVFAGKPMAARVVEEPGSMQEMRFRS
jgi:sn-glycerol 3-phosphate transport system ATP-binding protein